MSNKKKRNQKREKARKVFQFFLLTLITAYLSTWHWKQRERVLNVVEVEGVLLESDIREDGDDSFPEVLFRYQYWGEEYDSDRYHSWEGKMALKDEKEFDQFYQLQKKKRIRVKVPLKEPEKGYLSASDFGGALALLQFFHFIFLAGSLRKTRGFVIFTWGQYAFSALLAIDLLVSSYEITRSAFRSYLLSSLGIFLAVATTQYFFWIRVQQHKRKTRESIT